MIMGAFWLWGQPNSAHDHGRVRGGRLVIGVHGPESQSRPREIAMSGPEAWCGCGCGPPIAITRSAAFP
jgi:hypothetical protein